MTGLPLASLLLAAGLRRKNKDLILAGLTGLLLMALLSAAVYRTGAPAVHVVRGISGVERASIRAHSSAARAAMWGVLALGLASLGGLWLAAKSRRIPAGLAGAVLAGGAAVSVWIGWVAHLGGLIRHPEIVSGYEAPVPATSSEATIPSYIVR